MKLSSPRRPYCLGFISTPERVSRASLFRIKGTLKSSKDAHFYSFEIINNDLVWTEELLVFIYKSYSYLARKITVR